LSLPGVASAGTIQVPGDYPSIQRAINHADDGDTVAVRPGVYQENLDFKGKAITVKSVSGPTETIIDGGFQDPVVWFHSGEGLTSVLSGFTLRHGATSNSDAGSDGAGIQIAGSSPKIVNNIIKRNDVCGSGGGIAVLAGSPLIKRNVITQNEQVACSGGPGGGGISVVAQGEARIIRNVITANSHGFGGGISLFAAGATVIRGNVIIGNEADTWGGGVSIVNDFHGVVVGNLIADNSGSQGGGIYASVPSGSPGPQFVNNTIAFNHGDGVAIYAIGFYEDMQLVNNIAVAFPGTSAVYCDPLYGSPSPIITFNNAYSGGTPPYAGTCGDAAGTQGNISFDPLFVDPAGGNYHLRQRSPSVDAGTNDAPSLPGHDIDGDPRILGGVVDQGMDEVVPSG
jgi:hypothetical protein